MIHIENVSKYFDKGTSNELLALDNINLEIADGEFVTIIGTNGSGKTTLLNMIAGTIYPDEGRIVLNNTDITKYPDYKRASYVSRVFQNPFSGTAPDMTIAENLMIAYKRGKIKLPIIGLNRQVYSFFQKEIIKLEMQLENRLDTMIGRLSGGQRQAITLLMSVLIKPDILLLDEHTAALDPKTGGQVLKLTKEFIERDKLTTIMITHSMQQALELGTKTIMMYKGRIIDVLHEHEKQTLTTDDLLDKFADLRKKEKLTDEILDELRKEYL
ncbi:MAG: ATP-binding cassette domain-containing protein [Desulfobacterales bacterium]|nr:ATP-binding cassette domain-containing protein [Desulfobacterales bacterium]MBF0398666.1 ATP-binding cassette domain-containing protein [Desulfobacterales bacterium]